MAPPELARDAPGLDVLHPVEIGLLPVLRHEPGAAGLHRGDRRRGELLGVDVPLVGEERLDRHVAAVAVRDHVGVRLDLLDEARRLEPLDDPLARREAVDAVQVAASRRVRASRRQPLEEGRVVAQIELRLDVEDVDLRQVVPPADLEIVEVVRRRDLDRAGALLGIGIFVRDDRNAPADQRQDRVLADQVAVALVVRMDRDGGVAEHRLGPRRRDDDVSVVSAFDRIFDVPERALDLDLLHLQVGDRGQQLRVPVDQPLVLVDQVLPVEVDEDLEHGLATAPRPW